MDTDESSRARAARNAPGGLAVLGGLSDAITGGARAAAANSLGWPGDLEKMLVETTGADANRTAPALSQPGPGVPTAGRATAFPTSAEIGALLPSATHFSMPPGTNSFETLGGFAGASPKQLGRVVRAVRSELAPVAERLKGLAPTFSARGGVETGDNSARDALQAALKQALTRNTP